VLQGKKIIVVIPSYNVEKQIFSTIKGVPDFVDYIIVVDDCSMDQTVQKVSEISDDRIVLVKNIKNLGVGGATIEGFIKGLELGGEIFVKFDGDGQMDPNKMEELIQPLFEFADYAKGNRFLYTSQLQKMPRIRLVGNFLLTFLTKLASGYWKIFDPQNGYIAITREFLEKINLDNLHKRYFFENDMLINLNIIGARIHDISMPAIYGNEKSSLKIRKILFSFPWLLIGRFLNRIYKKYVLTDFSVIGFFYFCGLFLIGFGACFGAYHWFFSIYSNIPATTGTVMISVLPIILGFQLFLQAIVIELNEK